MNYIVAKLRLNEGQALRPRAAREGLAAMDQAPTINLAHADKINTLYTTMPSAVAAAEELAKKNPGEQYAVFAPVVIRESKATLISKKVSESGEIVLDTPNAVV
jgi:hypothetical protein